MEMNIDFGNGAKPQRLGASGAQLQAGVHGAGILKVL